MGSPPLRLLEQSFPERAAFDTALSRVLLDAVAGGAHPEHLRLYTPGDVLAFSLVDRRRPGFAQAVAIARSHGFAPVLRLTGGRAAVFHRETLAFAWCQPVADARTGIRARFDRMAALLCAALRALGLDARTGEVPGEYCPGEHSVNLAGSRKVAGVGQRVVKGAAHVGGVVVVRDAARVRRVLEPVYEALDYPLDPRTIGSLEDAAPAITRDDVVRALCDAFGAHYDVVRGRLSPGLLERAASARARQAVETPEDPADGPHRPLAGKALASP